MTVQFELAGKRSGVGTVFLTSDHRVYKPQTTVFHRNDYHTIVKMSMDVFKTNFKYDRLSGIYTNLTNITWDALDKIAFICSFKL